MLSKHSITDLGPKLEQVLMASVREKGNIKTLNIYRCIVKITLYVNKTFGALEI